MRLASVSLKVWIGSKAAPLAAHYYPSSYQSAEVVIEGSAGILSSTATTCFSISFALAWCSLAAILWWQRSCGAGKLNAEASLSTYWSLCIQTRRPSVVFEALRTNQFTYAEAAAVAARTGIWGSRPQVSGSRRQPLTFAIEQCLWSEQVVLIAKSSKDSFDARFWCEQVSSLPPFSLLFVAEALSQFEAMSFVQGDVLFLILSILMAKTCFRPAHYWSSPLCT